LKRYLAIAIALVSFRAIASADTFTVLPDRAAQITSPTFDLIDWGANYGPANNFSVPASTTWTSFNGATGTITNVSGRDMAQVDQTFPGGGIWEGNFDIGESLLYNQNNRNNPADGTIVNFNTPVNSVGFGIDADFYGSFTGQLEAFGKLGNLLFKLDSPGVANGNSDGSELFLGLQDLSGPNIYSIDIQTGLDVDINDFAIDDISMTSDAAVPEPGSIVLLASALLCVAGLLRRRLSGESA